MKTASSRYYRGLTLIELLIVIIISSISLMALSVPFVAQRVFSISGNNQTESQRDAQLVLRAMARAGRECNAYTWPAPGFPAGATNLEFKGCPNDQIYPVGNRCFSGGPAFSGGKLTLTFGNCQTPSTRTLIDGVRSKVAEFTLTQVIPNKLVRVRLQVTHQPTATSSRVESEVLETDLFLRNAT